MSKVTFAADPSGVLRSFEQIRQAISRAGQAGREFSQLDLSHPELKDLAAQIKTAQGTLAAYPHISPNSSLSRGLRQSGQTRVAPWDIDYSQAIPNEAERQRALERLMRQLQNGAGWNQGGAGGGSSPPAGGTPAPSPDSGSSGDAGLLGNSKLAMLAARHLGKIAIAGAVMRRLTSAYDPALKIHELANTASRQTGGATDFDAVRRQIRDVGKEFGVVALEAAQLSTAYARASGTMEGATDGAENSLRFAAGFGLDRGRTNTAMGGFQLAGAFGSGSISQREFVLMLGETISRGGMWSRGEDVMAQLGRSVDRMSELTLGAPNSSMMLAAQMAAYKLGNDPNSGMPGLRGAAGESLMTRAMGGVTDPATEAGKFALIRALNAAGVTDPFSQSYAQSLGAFGTIGDVDGSGDQRSMVEVVMNQWNKEKGQLPPGHAQNVALGERLNISPRQAEVFESVWARIQEIGEPRQFANLMDENGIALESLNPSGIKEMGDLYAAQMDGPEAMRGFLEAQIKARGLDREKADELRALSPGDLQSALLQMIATSNRAENDHTEYVDVTARLSRAMDDLVVIGIPVVRELKDSIVALIDPVGTIASYLSGDETSGADGKGIGGAGVAGIKTIGSYLSSDKADDAWVDEQTQNAKKQVRKELIEKGKDGAMDLFERAKNKIMGTESKSSYGVDVYRRALEKTGNHEESLVIAAQAALETGNGVSTPNGNHFGIKGGSGKKFKTMEMVNGKMVPEYAQFESHGSLDESIAARIAFTKKNPRYRQYGYFDAETAEEKALALKNAKYATDSKYFKKLSPIIRRIRKDIERDKAPESSPLDSIPKSISDQILTRPGDEPAPTTPQPEARGGVQANAASAPINLTVNAWRDQNGRLQVKANRGDGNSVQVAQAAGAWRTQRPATA